ncbi:alpha/beta-hydrolase [Gloeopeniophorella convolvens]|nr:alpha/beta-hydrolase [Gloeopeniophorella convolvens]
MSEQPFQIAVPDDALALLKRKLDDARFPDEVDEAAWDYGAPLADIKRLVNRWKDGYDWRTHESKFNKLPMFTRDIDVEGFGTLNVHYVHQKSAVEGAIPLLFVHGWPGSFIEVTKILPLLTAGGPDQPSFHVIAPSLPGYAWSSPALKRGFRGKQYAELFNKLMISLGYKEYVTQGGDWGYYVRLCSLFESSCTHGRDQITRMLAAHHGPQNVKASHTNFPRADEPTFWASPVQYIKHNILPYTALERQGLARRQQFIASGRGYYLEHATRPQTIGYNLSDSPVGMLAWIYEKLVAWTDSYPWTDDEILTWISIYWFSRAGPAASVRIYYEIGGSGESMNLPRATIPYGVSYFPKEIASAPKAFMRGEFNVVFESEHTSGGHFAAFENPQGLVDDLRKMFGKKGPAAGVVPGHSGF